MLIKNLIKTLCTNSALNATQITRRYSQDYVPKALRSLKAKSTRSTVQFYVDSTRVRAVAGNGGDGCISFLSAWCKDHAGPDGGDGGHGGHVVFRATHTVKSLNHCKTVISAKHGEKGYNKDCDGKNAPHVITPVPLGTIIKDESGRVLADMDIEGMMFVAARGGAGGRGNKFFLTDTHQAPDIAELGAAGETKTYTLEVRSMAHVGLLGFPNAGKSTLLRALTRARPTVAPYPFTTLRPHIGIVPYDDYEQVAIADLPGLIPGSHKNYGLGIQFLQHVERCRGLIFFLDGTDNPQMQYDTLTNEIKQYNINLTKRPSCIVVNKIDLEEGRVNFERMNRRVEVIGVSAKTGLNLGELLKRIRVMYDSGN
ncbi:mitochondrial ribosome-associated GTPase 2 [Aphomia sociella]